MKTSESGTIQSKSAPLYPQVTGLWIAYRKLFICQPIITDLCHAKVNPDVYRIAPYEAERVRISSPLQPSRLPPWFGKSFRLLILVVRVLSTLVWWVRQSIGQFNEGRKEWGWWWERKSKTKLTRLGYFETSSNPTGVEVIPSKSDPIPTLSNKMHQPSPYLIRELSSD